MFRGGGRVFGPRPRNYEFKLNKKGEDFETVNQALSQMAKDKNIIVLEDFSMDSPSTKGYVKSYLI